MSMCFRGRILPQSILPRKVLNLRGSPFQLWKVPRTPPAGPPGPPADGPTPLMIAYCRMIRWFVLFSHDFNAPNQSVSRLAPEAYTVDEVERWRLQATFGQVSLRYTFGVSGISRFMSVGSLTLLLVCISQFHGIPVSTTQVCPGRSKLQEVIA